MSFEALLRELFSCMICTSCRQPKRPRPLASTPTSSTICEGHLDQRRAGGDHRRQGAPGPALGRRHPSAPGEAKDRLLELHYILERLRDVYTAEGADIWIHGRNRDLGGEKPIDLLAAGQFERVLAAVERLGAGAM